MKKAAKNTTKYQRPSWDEYFLKMVEMVGTRGTCDRGRSGCVIVKDKRILATGYVGSPMGIAHCDDIGHEMHTLTREDGTVSRHCLRTAHAELNAIANAARSGASIDGSILYCKMVPCYTCAKTIINAGIKRVVSLKDYHATKQSKIVFKQAGVKLEIINKKIEPYNDQ
ncbi:MAG: cytidine/deoxycytidylate deaminase family protein [Candidatus Paceibacterota bacterium]|jgi:dCMP deaminase